MLASGVLGGVVLSVFGVLVSWGLAVELPAASGVLDGAVGVLSGAAVGVPVACGSVVGGAVSGTLAPGAAGVGLVLLPPDGVCSLIGWLLCDCASCDELLDGVCAATNPADRIATVARYMSFFIPGFSLPLISICSGLTP